MVGEETRAGEKQQRTERVRNIIEIRQNWVSTTQNRHCNQNKKEICFFKSCKKKDEETGKGNPTYSWNYQIRKEKRKQIV